MANPKTVNERAVRDLINQATRQADQLTQQVFLKGLGSYFLYSSTPEAIIRVVTRKEDREPEGIHVPEKDKIKPDWWVNYIPYTQTPKDQSTWLGLDRVKEPIENTITWLDIERNPVPKLPMFISMDWGFMNPTKQTRTEKQMHTKLKEKLSNGVKFVQQVEYIKDQAAGYKYVVDHLVCDIAVCRVSIREIAFDSKHLELMPWYELIETLLHEIAHIHTNTDNQKFEDHGPRWRREFNKLIGLLEAEFPGWPEPVEQSSHGEMANTADLKSAGETLEGSSPSARTIETLQLFDKGFEDK